MPKVFRTETCQGLIDQLAEPQSVCLREAEENTTKYKGKEKIPRHINILGEGKREYPKEMLMKELPCQGF